MRTYVGIPPHKVLIDGKEPLPLEPSLRVINHSPTGFSWGYGGSGPSQLALAILLAEFNDPEFALRHHQDFKRAFIAQYRSSEGFVLTSPAIAEWRDSLGVDAEAVAE